jgi:hypothetical protein
VISKTTKTSGRERRKKKMEANRKCNSRKV